MLKMETSHAVSKKRILQLCSSRCWCHQLGTWPSIREHLRNSFSSEARRKNGMFLNFRSLKGGAGGNPKQKKALTFSFLVKQSKASGVLVVATRASTECIIQP